MNYANHKTALNKITATSIVINLFAGGYIINSNYNMQSDIQAITQELATVESIVVPENTSSANDTDTSIKINECNDKIKEVSEMEIPDCDTYFKTYMDYRNITDETSAQYKLQQNAWTDEQGLRRYEDYYLVAMGTYYSDNVGDTFKITIENGNTFYVMVGDIKSDKHTDDKNMYSSVYDKSGKFISADVIEFIVDTTAVDRKVKRLGSVSAYDDFSGNITAIERGETIDIWG